MKTMHILTILLTVLLLLLPLGGCEKKKTDFASVEGQHFIDLTPTDKLVIYVPRHMEAIERNAVNRYIALYGVDVDLVVVPYDDLDRYTERVINDLAGGSGPDILFLHYLQLDIAKTALSHNFLDLTDILTEDPDFSKDEYLADVFEAGCFGGRQYTIPTTVVPTFFLTVPSKLEELGFCRDKIQKFNDFLEEIVRVTPTAKAANGYTFKQMMESQNYFSELFAISGIQLLDYEQNIALPDEGELRDFLYAYKSYFPYDYDESGFTTMGGAVDRFLGMGQYYFWQPYGILVLTKNISAIKDMGLDYELYTPPDQMGKTTGYVYGQFAVSANAKNKLNAYNYIKMQLSADVQVDRWLSPSYLPVNKAAVRAVISGSYEYEHTEGVHYELSEDIVLSGEEAELLFKKITEPRRYTQNNPYQINVMLFESMLPFFKDERSYDDCLKDLKNKLTFYLSE